MTSSKVFNYTAIEGQFLFPSLPCCVHVQVDFDLRLLLFKFFCFKFPLQFRPPLITPSFLTGCAPRRIRGNRIYFGGRREWGLCALTTLLQSLNTCCSLRVIICVVFNSLYLERCQFLLKYSRTSLLRNETSHPDMQKIPGNWISFFFFFENRLH
jgi:hypothetical protein